jgi:hypothetical protein
MAKIDLTDTINKAINDTVPELIQAHAYLSDIVTAKLLVNGYTIKHEDNSIRIKGKDTGAKLKNTPYSAAKLFKFAYQEGLFNELDIVISALDTVKNRR